MICCRQTLNILSVPGCFLCLKPIVRKSDETSSSATHLMGDELNFLAVSDLKNRLPMLYGMTLSLGKSDEGLSWLVFLTWIAYSRALLLLRIVLLLSLLLRGISQLVAHHLVALLLAEGWLCDDINRLTLQLIGGLGEVGWPQRRRVVVGVTA